MKMKRKVVYGIVLTVLLTGILTSPTNIQKAKAQDGFGYIYSRADGIIDPPDAPISKDAENVTYSLTADIINKSIIIERDNIIFDGGGFKISGPEEENKIGINVTSRYNVTITNTVVEKFDIAIYVRYSTKIKIEGNNASNNNFYIWGPQPDFEIFLFGTGISVTYSNDTIISNNIASNNLFGILVGQSNNTQIINNKASNNYRRVDFTHYGIAISIANTRNNTVTGNTVTDNGMGIRVLGSLGSNNTIRNNTITGTYNNGIYLAESRNNTIVENKIFSNFYGIYVCSYSQGNTIINNNISANSYCGIYFDRSTNNFLIDNLLFKNADGIVFENNVNNNVILHNTVSNSSSFGIYIRTDSQNNLVVGNNISNNSWGIRFTQSNNNIIFGNTISSNTNDGLVIYYYSSNNEVRGNNITLNKCGISITYGCYNTKIFHNNFIGNMEHVYTNMNSTWDNGYPSGGNYWDNYAGVDFKWGITQNVTGSDGIGDAAYSINENNTDRYPLMGPINIFEAEAWDATIQYVDVISNSTVSNFKINITEKVISFNVTGKAGAGFCRVIIPKTIVNTLWLGNYMVLVNGVPVEFRNWTDTENVYLYFEYLHSEKEVTIIQEFPFAAFATLLMLATTLTLLLKSEKVHNQNCTLFGANPSFFFFYKNW